jgi:hypothetical protein
MNALERSAQVQKEHDRIISTGRGLFESYKQFSTPVQEAFAEKKRVLSPSMQSSLGFCYKNLEEGIREKLSSGPMAGLMEAAAGATTSNDIAFTNWAFQLVSAILPNLIAEEIFSVQPMERRKAQIFYLDIIAESKKGQVAINNKLASAEAGFNADPTYPLQQVADEDWGTGTGAEDTYSGNHDYTPGLPGTYTLRALNAAGIEMVVTDDGEGKFIGDIAAGTNTITYSNGAYDVTFSANVANGAIVYATYEYDMKIMPELTPKIRLTITDKFINAIYATLGSIWIMHAGYDLQKAHGIDGREVLMQTQAGLIRRAIDMYLLQRIRTGATGGSFSYPYTAPTGVSKQAHYEAIQFKLREMSTTIAKNTRMNAGNLIVCGQIPFTIIAGLQGFQKRGDLTDSPQGPYIAGTWNEYTVVYAPDYPIDEFVMGHKGSNYLTSNFVYAPYMPFFTSEITWLNFFEGYQGTGAAFGAHMIRSAGYVNGKIEMT